MRIKPSTTVGRLIEEHPEAEEVMAWYGIDLEEYRPSTTLASLCRGKRLDVDEVIADLASSLEELEDEDEEDWDEEEEEEGDDLDPGADRGYEHEDDDAWGSEEEDLDSDLDEDEDGQDDGDEGDDEGGGKGDEEIADGEDPFDLN